MTHARKVVEIDCRVRFSIFSLCQETDVECFLPLELTE